MTQKELEQIGCGSLEDMITEDFGEIGTPERDQFELSCNGELLKDERISN